MRNLSRVVICSAVLALFPTFAAAEPITANFGIFVLGRWDYQAQAFEPFYRGFELSMTFSGRSRISQSPDRAFREYEPPSFTAVPEDLVVASRPAGLAVTERRSLTDYWTREPEGYRRFTSAAVSTWSDPDGNRYFLGLSLGRPSLGILSSPPELTIASMLDALGRGDLNHAFLYTGTATDESGRYLPNSYQYQGTVTLIGYTGGGDAPVVPEPGTIFLLGSSLAYLGLRLRRPH